MQEHIVVAKKRYTRNLRVCTELQEEEDKDQDEGKEEDEEEEDHNYYDEDNDDNKENLMKTMR